MLQCALNPASKERVDGRRQREKGEVSVLTARALSFFFGQNTRSVEMHGDANPIRKPRQETKQSRIPPHFTSRHPGIAITQFYLSEDAE